MPDDGGQIAWTEAQRRGIETTGHSLLVSAAAGSGKTEMLAARCAHLVCDASPPCDVDQLLVVTFTEAAAAEMKKRIHAALRRRAAASQSHRIGRQLALIDHASISTLHSFCARLLREHFHAVRLDPAFSVIDGDEAAILRREVARDLFEDRFELDGAGDFHRFIDAYGEGTDERLARQVVQTHEMIRSLLDPQAWIDHSRQRILQPGDGALEQTELGAELMQLIGRGIAEIGSRCDQAIKVVQTSGNFPVYIDALNDCGRILRHWERTLATKGIDDLSVEVGATSLKRLPSVSNSVPGKEPAKAAVDSIREGLTKGSFRDLLRFTTSQWKQGLAAIGPHAQIYLSLVEEFSRRYDAIKAASRVVDFSDLERLALKVLGEQSSGKLVPSPAARAFHRQFAHVLVDEYQDINEVQDGILALLSRECVCAEPGQSGNLFCVGDVKQSIYRFRLAEAGRFIERQKLFRDDASHRRGEVIDLQSNFRSRAPLLDAINGVFERLMTAEAADIDYDRSHRLEAALKYPQGGANFFTGSPIEMHLLPADLTTDDPEATIEGTDGAELDRSEREAALIARRIRQLVGLDGNAPAVVIEKHGTDGMQPRPIRFRDVVILLRSMQYKAEQFANMLRRTGIPVHAQSNTGFFESMEVRDMLSLLAVLDNQRQDIPLAAVLRSPLANLPEAENCLARIRIAFPAAADDSLPFHDAVVRYALEKDDELAAALRDFLARLKRWREFAHSRPPTDMIQTIYHETGLLAFCSALHDGPQRVANLTDLHRRATQFGSFRRQGLRRFMHFLEALRDEDDLGQPPVASEADDVVRIMSIHKAKGLEFPVVVLPDLGKRINLSDSHGSIVADRKAGLGMSVVDLERMVRYPSLASVLMQQRLRQQAMAEELRVLYVAMTRAKEHLILVGTCGANQLTQWTNRWAGHDGPFSTDAILGARSMLEWLGPAAAAAKAAGPIIQITQHTTEEVAAWQAAHAKRPALSPQQARLAALEPLDPPPPIDAVARQVIEQFESVYPFEHFTRTAAVDSVTRRGKEPLKAEDSAQLARPRFFAGQPVCGADVGTATHEVLFHLDFARSCDAQDLSFQISNMVERKLIGQAEADLVDQKAILWLAQSDIGSLLRSNASSLRREFSIYFPAKAEGAPQSCDPQDRVMIRGRIDAWIPLERGGILIDYKTDNVTPDEIADRAALYASQMRQYQEALQGITKGPVGQAYLVFLTPRVVYRL